MIDGLRFDGMEKDADGLALNDPLLFWAECLASLSKNHLFVDVSKAKYLTKSFQFNAYLRQLICFKAVNFLKEGRPDVLL